MPEEFTLEVKNIEIIALLAILGIFYFFEVVYVTLPSPISFGDEGFHVAIAKYIAQNLKYPMENPIEGSKLVTFTFFRPPYWNLMQGGLYLIFGFSPTIVKLLNPFIGVILTGLTVFLIGKKFFSQEVGFIAAVIVASIPALVTYSVLFYTDAFLTFNLAVFILTFFMALKTESKKYLMLAGIFASLTYLTKTSGIVFIPIILLGFLYKYITERSFRKHLTHFAWVLLPIVLIVGSFFIRNIVYYKSPACDLPILNKASKCEFTFNYNNTESFSGAASGGGVESSVLNFGILNYADFAYGNIFFVFLGVLAGLITLVVRKNKFDVLILLVLVSFIPVFYFGSLGRAEDASRYTLGVTPVLALISGSYFGILYSFIRTHFKKISIVVLIIVVFFAYQNMIGKVDGMKQVKQFSPSFFEACDWAKKNTDSKALFMAIWDHQTAYNCERKVIAPGGLPDQADVELSSNANLVHTRLKAHGIDYVFIQKFSITTGKEQNKYPVNFIGVMDLNKDKFKNVFENGPAVSDCIKAGGCDGNIIYQVL